MDSVFLRVGALLAHCVLNIIIVSWLVNFDISGSWMAVTGFIAALFVLLIFFIIHLVAFLNFIKTKTK